MTTSSACAETIAAALVPNVERALVWLGCLLAADSLRLAARKPRADQSGDAAGPRWTAFGWPLSAGRTGELELAGGEPRAGTPHRCRRFGTPIQAKADTPHARRSNAETLDTTRADGTAVVAIAHYFAARAPAAMITKIAKPIIAHQAMLSVSLCHLRTSHMTQTPFRRDCWS
jgi:hypothetical protein